MQREIITTHTHRNTHTEHNPHTEHTHTHTHTHAHTTHTHSCRSPVREVRPMAVRLGTSLRPLPRRNLRDK